MMKALWVVMLITFMSGFATGAVVYFNAQEDSSGRSLSDTERVRGFEIFYDEYGLCRDSGCISYYIDSSAIITVNMIRDGRVINTQSRVLDEVEMDTITNTLRNTPFSREEMQSCRSRNNSYARVMVRIGDSEYQYDTCSREIPNPTGAMLVQYRSMFFR